MAFSSGFCAYLHFFCLCYKMKTNEVIGMYMTAQRKRLFNSSMIIRMLPFPPETYRLC